MTAARGHYVSKEFCTPEVEEEREEAEGNPNGVTYAVAVKTDVEIIVGNLLRQISTACSLFLRWSGTILHLYMWHDLLLKIPWRSPWYTYHVYHGTTSVYNSI